jgi:hypothetical protein
MSECGDSWWDFFNMKLIHRITEEQEGEEEEKEEVKT